MIVSHGRKYIFIHIPKTGGTAMALALEGRAMKDDIMLGDTPKAKKRRGRVKDIETTGRLWKHSNLEDIGGLVDPDRIGDYFVFTLVRNPWDRMVSYYHWLGMQNFEHPAVGLAKALTFSEFLNHPRTKGAMRASPYVSYIKEAKPPHFIRLECFEQDTKPLWAHLGFELDLPLINVSSRRKDYRGYYNDHDAGVLAQVCSSDIKQFNYEFE